MTSAIAVKRIRVRRRARRHHQSLPSKLARFGFVLVVALPISFFGILLAEIPTSDWVAFNSGLSPDQITVEPVPPDCGMFSGCHYERHDIVVKDKKGEHIVVTWKRVND